MDTDKNKETMQAADESSKPTGTDKHSFPFGAIIAGLVILFILAFVGYELLAKSVPNMVGMEKQEAIAAMKELHFSPECIYEYSSDYSAGQVTSQDQTDKWLPFLPVTLTVSLGENTSLTAVPDTVGQRFSDAVKALQESGFAQCRVMVEETADSEPGIVLSQSIPSGYEISKDSILNLILVSGDDPMSADINGQTIFFPTASGDSLEINLKDGTSSLTKVYVPVSYENAAYIHGVAGKYTEIDQKVFNQPVIIDGDHNSVILLLDETFNDDVVIRTGHNAVYIYVGGGCEFNGKICFENDIEQTNENTPLPSVFTDCPDISLDILHGSAAFYMLKKDIKGVLDGVEYEFDDALEFENLSDFVSLAPDYLSCSSDDPNMHFVKKRYENGEVIIEHKKSNLELH